jgi:hypothetical protein
MRASFGGGGDSFGKRKKERKYEGRIVLNLNGGLFFFVK